MTTCFYCGIKGHTVADCFKRKEEKKSTRGLNALNPKAEPSKRMNALNEEGNMEDVPIILMHTPMTINGVRFPKCLVNTNTMCNIILL